MAALYRYFLRALLTRGRLLSLGALGLVAIGLGLAVGVSDVDDPVLATARLVAAYGLAGLAPVTALVFASAAFGDLQDDQTLVYLWLRPVARWRMCTAALAAVLTIVVPLAVVPITVATALGGAGGSIVVGAVLATTVATIAYCSLFLWMGLRVQRALVWGLVYILIWEGAVANVGAGLARFAIRLWTRSVLSSFTDGVLEVEFGTGRVAGVIVPLLVAVVAFTLAVRRLQRTEVA